VQTSGVQLFSNWFSVQQEFKRRLIDEKMLWDLRRKFVAWQMYRYDDINCNNQRKHTQKKWENENLTGIVTGTGLSCVFLVFGDIFIDLWALEVSCILLTSHNAVTMCCVEQFAVALRLELKKYEWQQQVFARILKLRCVIRSLTWPEPLTVARGLEAFNRVQKKEKNPNWIEALFSDYH